MFAQYDLETGQILATNSAPVDAAALLAARRGQIEVAGDVNGMSCCIDLTGEPCVVPRPPEEELSC